ncbi:MAG: hypothetical protein IJS13_07240 [Paludibacteraceae bacterium]|nr:hypothetical protein [Paludibacteraceae bacterium]
MIDLTSADKPKIRKEKPFEDTLLYKQTMDFREAIKGILQNMNARQVPMYGVPMNDALRSALVNYRLCYLEGANNYNDKVAFMRASCEKFAEVDVLVNEWYAVGIINKKTYCRFAAIEGGILEGSKRFYEAIKKRRDNSEDEIKAPESSANGNAETKETE